MKQLRNMLGGEQSDTAPQQSPRSRGARVDAAAVLVLASVLPFLFAATCSAHEEEVGPTEDPTEHEMSAAACLELQERLYDKSSRTASQRKISSDLLLSVWAEQCEADGHPVSELRTRVEVDEAGFTVIDIKANVTEQLLSLLDELSGNVISSFPKHESVRARIPIRLLEELAASPDVNSIRSADEYRLNEPTSNDQEGRAR